MHAFSGLITTLCRQTDVPKETLDYMLNMYLMPFNVTNIKRSEQSFGPTMTTQEQAYRYKLIMGRIYDSEILCHIIRGHPSTTDELYQVDIKYPMNDHAKLVLGIKPRFFESMDDDISTYVNHV